MIMEPFCSYPYWIVVRSADPRRITDLAQLAEFIALPLSLLFGGHFHIFLVVNNL